MSQEAFLPHVDGVAARHFWKKKKNLSERGRLAGQDQCGQTEMDSHQEPTWASLSAPSAPFQDGSQGRLALFRQRWTQLYRLSFAAAQQYDTDVTPVCLGGGELELIGIPHTIRSMHTAKLKGLAMDDFMNIGQKLLR